MNDLNMNSPGVPEMEDPKSDTQQESVPTTEKKTMSAMERRLAEPFDMPGAYIPGEKYDPANAVPRPDLSQRPAGTQEGRRDLLDEMFEQRDQRLQKGAKKAKILGIVVLCMTLFDCFSTVTSEYSDKIDNFIAVASLLIMAYGVWKFTKGSGKYRSLLGVLSLIDTLHSFTLCFSTVRTINLLNKLFNSDISVAPYVFMTFMKVIVFGALAYFFLFDKDVGGFASND